MPDPASAALLISILGRRATATALDALSAVTAESAGMVSTVRCHSASGQHACVCVTLAFIPSPYYLA